MMGLWLYAKSNKARISLPLFYNSFCVIFVHHIFGLNFDDSNKQPLRVDSMEDGYVTTYMYKIPCKYTQTSSTSEEFYIYNSLYEAFDWGKI